jgi:type III secretion system low calcium response chaperone LcrH/SycD
MPHLQKKTQDLDLYKILGNRENAENLAREVLEKVRDNPGMTLKDATGVSDKALEEVYCLAYNFYNQGKYRESISLFEFLAGACPKTYKYILGLASSYHQIQAYNEAFVGFYIALHLEPNNPIPAYYSMDCLLKQNLAEEALEFAEAASQICENRPEYAELKQRCELIAETLKVKK